MKTFHLIHVLLGLVLLQATACDSVIEQTPVSNFSSTNFWQTPDDAQAGVTAIYSNLQPTLASRELHYWGDARALTIDPFSTTDQQMISLTLNQLDQNMGSANWANLYETVNRANLAIANIPNIEGLRNGDQLLGEAYFLRALSYFYLVRIWGDVPLITEPPTSAEGLELPRTGKDQVLDQVEADVAQAVANLPISSSPMRASLGAAEALQAHVFAWRGKRLRASSPRPCRAWIAASTAWLRPS